MAGKYHKMKPTNNNNNATTNMRRRNILPIQNRYRDVSGSVKKSKKTSLLTFFLILLGCGYLFLSSEENKGYDKMHGSPSADHHVVHRVSDVHAVPSADVNTFTDTADEEESTEGSSTWMIEDEDEANTDTAGTGAVDHEEESQDGPEKQDGEEEDGEEEGENDDVDANEDFDPKDEDEQEDEQQEEENTEDIDPIGSSTHIRTDNSDPTEEGTETDLTNAKDATSLVQEEEEPTETTVQESEEGAEYARTNATDTDITITTSTSTSTSASTIQDPVVDEQGEENNTLGVNETIGISSSSSSSSLVVVKDTKKNTNGIDDFYVNQTNTNNNNSSSHDEIESITTRTSGTFSETNNDTDVKKEIDNDDNDNDDKNHNDQGDDDDNEKYSDQNDDKSDGNRLDTNSSEFLNDLNSTSPNENEEEEEDTSLLVSPPLITTCLSSPFSECLIESFEEIGERVDAWLANYSSSNTSTTLKETETELSTEEKKEEEDNDNHQDKSRRLRGTRKLFGLPKPDLQIMEAEDDEYTTITPTQCATNSSTIPGFCGPKASEDKNECIYFVLDEENATDPTSIRLVQETTCTVNVIGLCSPPPQDNDLLVKAFNSSAFELDDDERKRLNVHSDFCLATASYTEEKSSKLERQLEDEDSLVEDEKPETLDLMQTSHDLLYIDLDLVVNVTDKSKINYDDLFPLRLVSISDRDRQQNLYPMQIVLRSDAEMKKGINTPMSQKALLEDGYIITDTTTDSMVEETEESHLTLTRHRCAINTQYKLGGAAGFADAGIPM